MVCRICGNDRNNREYVAREMFFGTGEEFTYFECSSCGCLQIRTMPEDMQKFYPATYYSFNKVPEGSFPAEARNYMRAKRNGYVLFGTGFIGRLLQMIKPADMTLSVIARAGDLRQMAVLDVGCGNGMIPYQLKELGVERVTGIDPFIREDIRYGNGLEVLKKSLVELGGEEAERFDLIMFNHSFEHLPNPADTLKAATGLLRDGGTIMIRVPTASSHAWEHYRTDWVQLDAPRHFFLYSTDSLRILAKGAGLSVCDIVYDSNEFQFWGSEQYRKGIPMESPLSYKYASGSSLFSKKEIDSFSLKAAELNRQGRGDMAAFFMRKAA